MLGDEHRDFSYSVHTYAGQILHNWHSPSAKANHRSRRGPLAHFDGRSNVCPSDSTNTLGEHSLVGSFSMLFNIEVFGTLFSCQAQFLQLNSSGDQDPFLGVGEMLVFRLVGGGDSCHKP